MIGAGDGHRLTWKEEETETLENVIEIGKEKESASEKEKENVSEGKTG